jgi:ElaB/YqjD/DUF883 family membrane-anchored ribosome-binding protein
MSEPDRIREEIEASRAELGVDVDALTDKVSPSKIAHRQGDRAGDAMNRVRDRVMGAAPSTDDVKDKTAELGHEAKQKGRAMVEKAEGNPLAVGLIAFGVGLLAASLIPASDAERRAATRAKDAAAPVIDEMKDAAKETADNLKEPARDAAETVKDAAAQAGSEVKDEAQGAASDLKDHARDSATDVRDQQ